MEKKTYFLPSVHGWPFGNSFHFEGTLEEYLGVDWIPIVGNIEIEGDYGYCGGMCFTALDRFYQAKYLSDDLEAPEQGDVLYEEIKQRLFDSIRQADWHNIYDWQKSDDTVVSMMTMMESLMIRINIDAGRPVPLLLLRTSGRRFTTLIDNHQVIAYKYTIEDNLIVEIGIYDPNHPDDNDVSISFNMDPMNINISQSTGEPLRGFFQINYDRSTPTPTINNLENDGWETVEEGITTLHGKNVRYGQFLIKFHWSCNFIPYFKLLHNNALLSDHYRFAITDPESGMELVSSNNIKCKEASGSYGLLICIKKNRFHRPDSYNQPIKMIFVSPENHTTFSIEFIPPAIEAYPFIHSPQQRIRGLLCGHDIPKTMIADGKIDDVEIVHPNADLDSDEHLSESEIQNCWERRVYIDGPPINTPPTNQPWSIRFVIQYKLGFITASMKAKFEEEGLIGTINREGESYLINPLDPNTQFELQQFDQLTPLDSFEFRSGFSPENYDQDLCLFFDYEAKDQADQVASGQLRIFAKSLLCIHRMEYLTLRYDPSWDTIRFRIHEDTYLMLKERITPYLEGVGIKQQQEIRSFLEAKVEELVNQELEELETKSAICQQISQTNLKIHNSMKNELTNLLSTEAKYSVAMIKSEKLKHELTSRTAQNTAKILANEVKAKIEVNEFIEIVQKKFNLRPR